MLNTSPKYSERDATLLRRELLPLVSQRCWDELSAADATRLEELVTSNALARRVYAQLLFDTAALSSFAENHATQSPLALRAAALTLSPATQRSHFWISSRSLGWLAATVALAGMFWGVLAMWVFPRWRTDRLSTIAVDISSQEIGRLTAVANCKWMGSPQFGKLGDPVCRGQLNLTEGTAELTLDNGVQVVIEGPTQVDLQAIDRSYLHRGKLLAKVPKQAIGFTLATPSATVVDLGTEFAVEIDQSGTTSVFVLRGAVEAKPVAAAKRQAVRLTQHQGARIDFGSDVVTTIAEADVPTAQKAGGRREPRPKSHTSNAVPQTGPAIVLPIATIVPGSERVQLVPNGDFSARGEPVIDSGYPFPPKWTRLNDMFVAERLPKSELPRFCQGQVAICTIDARNKISGYQQSIRLASDAEYVLSAYLWNLGTETEHVAAHVDLSDADHEADLELLHTDAQAADGVFAYQKFHTGMTTPYLTVRLFYDALHTSDDGEVRWPVAAAWDNVAITPVSQFKPPQKQDPEPTSPTAPRPSQ
jgi:hypothetical protein